MKTALSLRACGREGGAASGVSRRGRILDRVRDLDVDQRVLEAYRQGYDAGYHAAQKRLARGRAA